MTTTLVPQFLVGWAGCHGPSWVDLFFIFYFLKIFDMYSLFLHYVLVLFVSHKFVPDLNPVPLIFICLHEFLTI